MLFLLFSFLACTNAQQTLTCDEGELDLEELAAGGTVTVPFDLTADQFHVFEIELDPESGATVTIDAGAGACTTVSEIDGTERKDTIQCTGTTTGSLTITAPAANAVELDVEVECEEPLSCDEDIEFLIGGTPTPQAIPVDIPAGATVTFEELCEDFTDFSLTTEDGTEICNSTICTAAGTEDCVVSNFSETATLTFVGPTFTGEPQEVELEVECDNVPGEEDGDNDNGVSVSSDSESNSTSSESDSDALTSAESADLTTDSGVDSVDALGSSKASANASMKASEESLANNLGLYLTAIVALVVLANLVFCAFMWKRGRKVVSVLDNIKEEMEEDEYTETIEMK